MYSKSISFYKSISNRSAILNYFIGLKNFHQINGVINRTTKLPKSLINCCPIQNSYKIRPSVIRLYSSHNKFPTKSTTASNGASSSSSTSTTTTDNGYQVYKKVPKIITIPKVWPFLPIVGTTRTPIFPKFAKTIEIVNPILVNLIRRKVEMNQPYIGIFLRRTDDSNTNNNNNNNDNDNQTELVQHLDEIYRIGAFAHIQEMHDYGEKLTILLNSHRRIIINKQLRFGDGVDLLFDTLPSVMPLDEPVVMVEVHNLKHIEFQQSTQIKAITHEIIKTIRDIIKLNPLYNEILQLYLKQDQYLIQDTIYLGDLGAALTSANAPELQEIMEEIDIPTRLMMVLSILKKEIEISKLQIKIAEEVEDTIKKVHRKFMLQEQMKVLKKEMGLDRDDKENIIEKYRARCTGKSQIIPTAVADVIEEEIQKLSALDSSHSEYNVIRNYLDWLTILPWGKLTAENLDLHRATDILNTDHYGMQDVKRRILEFIAVSKLKGSTQGKILCFHGPPGVGKTSIAKSIAQSLNRKYFRFSVGGLANVSEIKGHRRTYVGAMPGKLIQCLKIVQTENPLILIDEIDKIGRGEQGSDPSSALLELLDPEQNLNFLDHYIDVPIDLSKVLFICTANVLDTIPAALRDRMELIEMTGYVAEEKIAIARQYLIPKLLTNNGLDADKVEFSANALHMLINSYCRESGVRNLEQHIDKIIRKIAVQFVQNEIDKIKITAKNISNYLGNPDHDIENIYKITPPGVAVGLGWTALGGQTIYIETAKRQSSNTDDNLNGDNNNNNNNDITTKKSNQDKLDYNLELTGQLGSVMKESAEIALTVARNFMKNSNIGNRFLDTNKIHIHVPKGSIPKDGPSAGVTIVAALLSLALNKPLRQNMAMTGELSLGGKILPVGGIKEKTIAAKRNGVKCIILPEQNRKEFLALPEYIRNDIEVHFVDNYEDVYRVAFDTD